MRADAVSAWRAALEAVDPEPATARAVAEFPELSAADGSTLVVATGKAAAAMLRGVEHIDRGLAILPRADPHPRVPETVRVFRGGHPVPDLEGLEASRRILDEAGSLGRGQRLLYLVSGGTSALFEVPRAGIPSSDLIDAYRVFLACGAPIEAVNRLRGVLSRVKAGGLARAARPARVFTFALSDVGALPASVIGSGPTLAPPPASDPAGSIAAILDDFDLRVRLPACVLAALEESEAEGVERASASEEFGPCRVVANVSTAVDAACQRIEALGYRVLARDPLGMAGDADDCARSIVPRVLEMTAQQGPCALVWGGETTVRMGESAGRGGRCRHLALRLARLLEGRGGFACVAAGTDGRDGTGEAAGAVVDGGTAERAGGRAEVRCALERRDSGAALEAAGDAFVTGPTGTNVGDVLIVTASGASEHGAVLC